MKAILLILIAMTLDHFVVASPLISDGSVSNAKLANNAVTSAKILDGTIASADISTGAVTSSKILDGTIVSGDISGSAGITGAQIANSTIDLTAKVTGVLPIANGGSGTATKFFTASALISATGVVSNESDDFINGNCAIPVTGNTNCTLTTNYWSMLNCAVSLSGDVASGTPSGAIIISVFTTSNTTVSLRGTVTGSGNGDYAYTLVCSGIKL